MIGPIESRTKGADYHRFEQPEEIRSHALVIHANVCEKFRKSASKSTGGKLIETINNNNCLLNRQVVITSLVKSCLP